MVAQEFLATTCRSSCHELAKVRLAYEVWYKPETNFTDVARISGKVYRPGLPRTLHRYFQKRRKVQVLVSYLGVGSVTTNVSFDVLKAVLESPESFFKLELLGKIFESI